VLFSIEDGRSRFFIATLKPEEESNKCNNTNIIVTFALCR